MRQKPDLTVLLKQRATFIDALRSFWKERHVIEVETPVISPFANNDPGIESFSVSGNIVSTSHDHLQAYLHTSPEHAMKRLLLAGAPSIFQICKAFRYGEKGRLHRPEFTMMEWYRLDFDLTDLMHEVDLLLAYFGYKATQKVSYSSLFLDFFGINPHQANRDDLLRMTYNHQIDLSNPEAWSYQSLLELLFSLQIVPTLGKEIPTFVFDYPESMAALAMVQEVNGEKTAKRCELFMDGLEIANGYLELTDATAYQKRFEHEIAIRRKQEQVVSPIDTAFLSDCKWTLPMCSGMALGVDRFFMVTHGYSNIEAVLPL